MRFGALVLAVVGGGLGPHGSAIGAPVAPAPMPADPASSALARFSAILDDSEEAAHLLKRADDAIERQDWKLATDALQRLIELPGDSVLQTPEGVYESARRHAHRKIAALLPDGLATYRLLHDAQARVTYERAVAAYDRAALRGIVDRFFLTQVGDDAAMTLAGWELDEGRPAAAIALLLDLQTLYPDSDIPNVEVSATLALAEALAGRRVAAQRRIDILRKTVELDDRTDPRLDAIDRALASLSPVAGARGDDWPVFMGDSTRMGRMALVEPSSLPEAPWRIELPHATAGPLRDVENILREADVLPLPELVTDGQLGVVKCEGNLLAFDMITFETVWAAMDPAQATTEAGHAQQILFGQPERSPATVAFESQGRIQRLLLDTVDASVTLCGGLAVTVQRSADSLDALRTEARDTRMPGFAPQGPLVVRPGVDGMADRIAAFDLETGELRWQSGQSEQADDPLKTVEFLAVPVPVRDQLLVPYRSGADFCAAVLNQADGSLVRHVYLCGLGAGRVDSFTALHPCVADEVAYLPTGRGALIALDTTTWSIRWIVRYEQSLEINEERQRSGDAVLMVAPAARRPCSPLVATAGLLLAVPSDASYLYAFDRVDGRIVWRVQWGEHWYLLGADGGRCWLAGPTVTQVDLETGRPGWARAIGKPTGRGAISGDRLYLPTEDGLVVLNATSGDVIETRPVPASGRPLGNLLCWGTALYSCDIHEVRAWPDMTRAYEQAVAAHAQSPAEATVALRLASLELLRDEHARALQVLDGARVTDDRRAEQLAHMRVEALLALARRPGVAADEAKARLDEARRLARRPADQVRTGLALAEHSARLGRLDAAYRQYVEIALAPPNGQQIALPPGEVMLDVGIGLRQRAGVAIGSRLARLERDLDATQREAVASWLRERLDAAIALGAAAGLAPVRALTEPGVLDEIRRRAVLQLGVWAQQDDCTEEAQACFEAVLRDDGAGPPVAEALVRLAMVSLSPDELHMPLQAEACIERLRAEFATAMLPGSLIGSTEARVSGVAVAETLQGRIDPETLSRHDRAVRNLRLGPPGELAYVVAPLDADLLQIRTPRTEPMAETLLWLKDWTEVRADLAHDGTLLWRATLRLLDEPAPVPVPGRIPSAVFPLGMGRPPLGQTALLPQPHATSDGQIMVVASPQGLHAIGLATGLRLWSRPYTQTTSAAMASDRFVWAECGRLVSLDGYGRLALAGIADGDRVRWERDISAGSWAAVRLGGEYVVAVSDALDAVSVFHADDGRSLGEARFWQPTSETSRRLSLAVFDDLVCGPVSAAEVAAFELGAPGIERWRVRGERGGEQLAITGIFKPAPDRLAIGCERGLVKLVDPATGELLREIRLELPRARIFDGAISDDVLCLYAADGEQRDSFLIVAMDLSSGRMLWRYESQAGEYWSQGQYDYPLDNSLLRAARNAIPVVRLIGNQAARQRVPGVPLREQGSREIELTILDKRTGRSVGRPQTLAFGEGETITRIDQVLVWPDRVIVITDNACLAFAVEPPSEEGP